MVFLGCKKRLENITIVSYRGKKKVFEVGALPNKLYEYKRNKNVALENIVYSTDIFTDIGKGELAKKEDIEKEFGAYGEKAVRRILDCGTERRDSAAREHEQKSALKAVKEGIQLRIRSANGERLTALQVDNLLKKVGHAAGTDVPKVQISKIAKKAIALGYRRRSIFLRVLGEANWAEVEKNLSQGSFFLVYPTHVELSDDLYGAVHRHAEKEGVLLEEMPEEEIAEKEI